MLPIIQSLWIGGTLSLMEQLSIISFLKNGHPYHLYVYDEVKNIPTGVVVKDANKIIPSSKIFKYKDRDSYAGFANLFRYKLLLEKGNYWSDVDIVCLRPFPSNPEYVFVTEGTLRAMQINNCVIKAPIGSEIMNYCYDDAVNRDSSKLVWGETGPRLLHAAVEQFELMDYVEKPYQFCPIDWWCWYRLIHDPFQINRLETIKVWKEMLQIKIYKPYAVHLWNEMWRRNNVDKNGDFPPHSIYEQLKKRYLEKSESCHS